jgi:hypothetical protein
MVMPRSRSMSIESSTCSTISRSASAPVSWISRSAKVDLPWSMCATMEKLRMLSMAAAVMAGQITSRLRCGKRAICEPFTRCHRPRRRAIQRFWRGWMPRFRGA